jgi:hypothetical protein
MTGLRRERSRAYLGRSVGMSYTLNERSLAAHGLGQLTCTSLNENCYKVLPISLYLPYIYLKESLTLSEKLK